ncbi:MAG: c-type cytochrome [Betaproteobacteria bacterium]
MVFFPARLKNNLVLLAGLASAALIAAAPWSAACAQGVLDVSLMAGTCLNCHVSDSRLATSIPVIAGKPEAVLKAQLLAFKSDLVPAGTTIMNRLAKGYSDEEVDALAAYFSRLDATGFAPAGANKQ